ncbi:MAG: sigma factor-like helix-turn-helix DNA-binding protein [Planctomycetota bacterium]
MALADGHDGGDWARLEPLLDAALATLPEGERACICLHFLEGRSQEAVARELGLGQATVSRRIDTGLQRLRRRLGAAGLVLGLNALATLCRGQAVESVPPTIVTPIPKLALAAMASGGATVATGGLLIWSLAATGLIAAVLTAALIETTPTPPTANPVGSDDVEEKQSMSPAANLRQDGQLIHLDPIPRFPRRVVRVDDQGAILAREEEPPWRDHLFGCLWTALRMRGIELSWERVFAASGRPWRLAIADDRWSHDAELVSAIDEIEALVSSQPSSRTTAERRSP